MPLDVMSDLLADLLTWWAYRRLSYDIAVIWSSSRMHVTLAWTYHDA